MLAITVTFKVKEDYVKAFEAAMKNQARNSLNREAGCHHFDVCFDPLDRGHVFLYELYTDEAAFDAHLKSAHFLDFDATVKNWLISKTSKKWSCWSKS